MRIHINAEKIALTLLARAEEKGEAIPLDVLINACAVTLVSMKAELGDDRIPEEIAREIEPGIRRAAHNWENAITI
jgi:hypothetical protein